MGSSIWLSIIIPAYNEEKRLPRTMEAVLNFLAHQSFSSEVIIVENGSDDATAEIGRDYADRYSNVSILQATRRGKGVAVQRGMLTAQGEFQFMADADLSMPIEEVSRFLPPKLDDFDIAIASREAPGSRRYDEPSYRHWGGRAINALIRLLALRGLHDTQCGFKCFRAPVAEDLFSHLTLTGWSFDVELLFIARQRGYRIREVPIPWTFNPESKINPIRDALFLILDILKIRWNAIQGVYEPQKIRPKPDSPSS